MGGVEWEEWRWGGLGLGWALGWKLGVRWGWNGGIKEGTGQDGVLLGNSGMGVVGWPSHHRSGGAGGITKGGVGQSEQRTPCGIPNSFQEPPSHSPHCFQYPPNALPDPPQNHASRSSACRGLARSVGPPMSPPSTFGSEAFGIRLCASNLTGQDA